MPVVTLDTTLTALCQTLTMIRGEAFAERYTLLDTTPAGGTVATDLTSATITWVLRDGPTPADTILLTKTEATPATEIEIEAPATGGTFLLKFITADTDSLTPNFVHSHELWVHLSDGRIRPVVKVSDFVVRERILAALP